MIKNNNLPVMIKNNNLPNINHLPLSIDYAFSKTHQQFIEMFEVPLVDYMPENYLSKGWNTNVEARIIGIEEEGLPEEGGKFLTLFFILIQNMPLVKLPPVFSTDIKEDSPNVKSLDILDYKLKIERESVFKAISKDTDTEPEKDPLKSALSILDTFDIMKYTFINKNDEDKFVRVTAVFYDKVTEQHVKVKDIFH